MADTDDSLSARERELLAVRNAAEDGDELAQRVYDDMAHEGGVVAYRELRPGDWCCIFTVAFYFIGKILHVDHEQYVLQSGSAQVFEAGPSEEFFAGRATQFDVLPVIMRLRRGGIIGISDWPLGRLPDRPEGAAAG